MKNVIAPAPMLEVETMSRSLGDTPNNEVAQVRGESSGPNPWVTFLRRRLGRLAISIVVLVPAAYLMVRLLPGDPARLSLGSDATVDQIERRRIELGLDQPVFSQYLAFWKHLFSGELGTSYSNRMPVFDVIAQRMPATLALAVLAIITILILGIPIGMVVAEATRGGRKRWLDLTFSSLTGFFTVAPVFVLAALAIMLFAINSTVFPVAGRSGPLSYVLPVAALSVGATCGLARIVRVETVAVLDTDYIRTARAKRMGRTRLYVRHVLSNLVTPTLTMAGLIFGSLIANSVFVETVFAWPGMGPVIVSSITGRDYPMVQGIVLVYGVLILVINLVVDLLVAVFDPRSRIETL